MSDQGWWCIVSDKPPEIRRASRSACPRCNQAGVPATDGRHYDNWWRCSDCRITWEVR